MTVTVRQLLESDDRSTFASGHPDLDRFFARYAGQHQFKLHIGATYVAVDESGTILGYVTVASCSIDASDLPAPVAKRFRYPIPALRLARMAVAKHLQRSGVGAEVMKAVFVLAKEQARRSGCALVVVDAKPGAETYYELYGFEAFPVIAGQIEARPVPRPMFLELGAIPEE